MTILKIADLPDFLPSYVSLVLSFLSWQTEQTFVIFYQTPSRTDIVDLSGSTSTGPFSTDVNIKFKSTSANSREAINLHFFNSLRPRVWIAISKLTADCQSTIILHFLSAISFNGLVGISEKKLCSVLFSARLYW